MSAIALSTIGLRAHAVPEGWQPRSKRRRRAPWPETALLLVTEPRACPGEPLRFGACALLASSAPGARPTCVRLFCPDDAPRSERETLRRVAERRGLPEPLTRKEFLALLYKRSYKQGSALVGFRLHVQLARLAADWRTPTQGGFALILWTRPCPSGRRSKAERRRRPKLRNGELEDGDRPRIAISPLDGQRAYIRFQGRGRPDRSDLIPEGEGGRLDRGHVFRGHFVELATLAGSHGNRRFSALHQAASAFGLDPEPSPDGGTGELSAEQVEAKLTELDELAGLYATLLSCHRSTPGNERCQPDEVYSPASYAEAILEQTGFRLPLLKWKTLPRSLLGVGMGALFGGDCGLAERHVPFLPVGYYDVTGEYAVAAHLIGAFELLCATKLEIVQEDPEALARFLAGLTTERLLTEPGLWKRLGRTICQVRPCGDLLPHRVPSGKGWLLKVSPLSYQEPTPYLLADLAISHLETGRLPEIVSALSLRPVPRRTQRLKPLVLPGGRVVDPRTDDLFLALAEERLRLERSPDRPEGERMRQAGVLKLIVNALCFGLFCQVNVDRGGGRAVEIVRPDGSQYRKRVDVLEEPGRWYWPPLAAGAAAAGRLILRLIRLLVEEAGGSVLYWDTDSVCVNGLTDSQMRAIQERLERLSPYSPELLAGPDEPLLLALEPENCDSETGQRRQLYLDATASKSYQLYTLQASAEGELRGLKPAKVSEHGLGHLRPPEAGDNWIEEGKGYLLRRALKLPAGEPAWWEEPALSVITLSRPDELRRLERAFGRKTPVLRPFCRLAVLHPTPQYVRTKEGSRRTPVACYHDSFDWRSADWRDLGNVEPLRPRLPERELTEGDLYAEDGRVLIETLGSTLERNRRRREAKALDRDGTPCGPNTVGSVQPAPTEAYRQVLIGKETRNLDRAGITEDPAYTLYSEPNLDAWQQTFLPTLRVLAPQLLTRGRPSRQQRAHLAQEAGALAREALRRHDPCSACPSDAEQSCYLYLKVTGRIGRRSCACGCGEPVQGRCRYVNSAHRTRAYRSRLAAAETARDLM